MSDEKGSYYQKMIIAAGGIIGRCVECKKTNLLRWATQITWLAGKREYEQSHTYRMCDSCCNDELKRFATNGGEIKDCRRPITETLLRRTYEPYDA